MAKERDVNGKSNGVHIQLPKFLLLKSCVDKSVITRSLLGPPASAATHSKLLKSIHFVMLTLRPSPLYHQTKHSEMTLHKY
jgi:hypothetical protein